MRRALRLLQRCEGRTTSSKRSFRRTWGNNWRLQEPTRWTMALAEAAHAQRAAAAGLENERAMWDAAVVNMRLWESCFSESAEEKGQPKETLVSNEL